MSLVSVQAAFDGIAHVFIHECIGTVTACRHYGSAYEIAGWCRRRKSTRDIPTCGLKQTTLHDHLNRIRQSTIYAPVCLYANSRQIQYGLYETACMKYGISVKGRRRMNRHTPGADARLSLDRSCRHRWAAACGRYEFQDWLAHGGRRKEGFTT